MSYMYMKKNYVCMYILPIHSYIYVYILNIIQWHNKNKNIRSIKLFSWFNYLLNHAYKSILSINKIKEQYIPVTI